MTNSWTDIKNTDLVVVMGGNEGVEAAISLAREGKKVTLVEETQAIAEAAYMYWGAARRGPLSRYLVQEKVDLVRHSRSFLCLYPSLEVQRYARVVFFGV